MWTLNSHILKQYSLSTNHNCNQVISRNEHPWGQSSYQLDSVFLYPQCFKNSKVQYTLGKERGVLSQGQRKLPSSLFCISHRLPSSKQLWGTRKKPCGKSKWRSRLSRVVSWGVWVHPPELYSEEGAKIKWIPPKITQVNHRAKPAHMSKWCQIETGSNRKPPKPLEACPLGPYGLVPNVAVPSVLTPSVGCAAAQSKPPSLQEGPEDDRSYTRRHSLLVGRSGQQTPSPCAHPPSSTAWADEGKEKDCDCLLPYSCHRSESHNKSLVPASPCNCSIEQQSAGTPKPQAPDNLAGE